MLTLSLECAKIFAIINAISSHNICDLKKKLVEIKQFLQFWEFSSNFTDSKISNDENALFTTKHTQMISNIESCFNFFHQHLLQFVFVQFGLKRELCLLLINS